MHYYGKLSANRYLKNNIYEKTTFGMVTKKGFVNLQSPLLQCSFYCFKHSFQNDIVRIKQWNPEPWNSRSHNECSEKYASKHFSLNSTVTFGSSYCDWLTFLEQTRGRRFLSKVFITTGFKSKTNVSVYANDYWKTQEWKTCIFSIMKLLWLFVEKHK